MSWQFRLPFTIRNLTVELRNSSLPKKAKAAQRNNSKPGSKLVLNFALRLLLGVLPNIPVRVKQITVKHQVLGMHC